MTEGILAGVGKKPVPEAMPIGELAMLGRRYLDPMDRALFYFLYLTGARISEALSVKVRDIDQAVSKDHGKFLKVKLLTRKNRRVKIREIPVPMREVEEDMIRYLMGTYVANGNNRSEDHIFNISRTNAWNRLAKVEISTRAIQGKDIIEDYVKGVNPHYLRHCRLTHLVQTYGFNELQLMRFAGWTNTKPAIVYVHLNWMDLAKVMTQASGEGWAW